MRIITGKAKGCKLKTPPGLNTRPTTDRVKESIFNILSSKTQDAQILDIFAGTGNMGLEALSRHGASAVFVDQNSVSINVIRDNAHHTKLIERATIIKGDVMTALTKFSQQSRKFDLVFCDPPYNKGWAQKVTDFFRCNNLLNRHGVLVMEHDKNDVLDGYEGELFRLVRSETYGITKISFYQLLTPEDLEAEG